MHLLIVEDDPLLQHHLNHQLTELGNQIRVAGNAQEALYYLQNFTLDLAIIDLGLPDMDGVKLIQTLRAQEHQLPVLILSGRADWEQKVAGLNAGADDYLVKPFKQAELIARLDALLRRSSGYVRPSIELGEYQLDLLEKSFFINGQAQTLTSFEYRILEHLMRRAGQVIAKKSLLDLLYQDGNGDPNSIEVMISRLRRKLKSKKENAPIQTIRGQGYRFSPILEKP